MGLPWSQTFVCTKHICKDGMRGRPSDASAVRLASRRVSDMTGTRIPYLRTDNVLPRGCPTEIRWPFQHRILDK